MEKKEKKYEMLKYRVNKNLSFFQVAWLTKICVLLLTNFIKRFQMDSLLFRCSTYFEFTDCQSCQKTHNFIPEFFPLLNVMRNIHIKNAINWLLF